MEVCCFDSLESAAHLREDIDALNGASARPDPFSTFSFYETFCRHDELAPSRRPLRLWFLAAFVAGRLVGYLALQQTARRDLGLRSAALGFLVTHDTDRPHLVAQPALEREVGEAFYAYLLSRRDEWSFLEFVQQDASSGLFPPPAAADLGAYLVRPWPSLENCSITIRWRSLREYTLALSKKFRANLRRQMRNLLGAGEVELLSSSDPAITPALLQLVLTIEPRSWKAQANADISRHPKRIAYFQALLGAQQPMRVSIHVLLLDGVPIAGLINGAFMGGLYALHIVYDAGLSALAPGSAMLLLGMREALAGSHRFFNLLSGFGYYKGRWLAQATQTQNMQIYRVGSLPFWHRLLGDLKRRLLPGRAAEAALLFNPFRRAVVALDDEPGDSAEIVRPVPNAAQRERIACLLAQVRAGRCELLSGAQLAAALPLEAQPNLQRGAPATPLKPAQRQVPARAAAT